MMIRPRSLNLTPTSSMSSSAATTFTTTSTTAASSSSAVGPVSPPATPLIPSSPESMSSPSLFPSPSSSSRSMSIKENVQVMVRLRPHSSEERTKAERPCWLVGPEPGMIQLPQNNRKNSSVFQYDAVVSGVDNKLVYDTGIGDLVRSTMAGYNGTVFAYGQTASGKTYTMMGTQEQPGVIPRSINELFTYIEENPGREFMLRVSYLEIYKEKIRDLIGEDNDDVKPEIREDKQRGVYVQNLREVIVNSAQQVLDVIKKGEDNRHISATDYNTHSSRSHTILQIVIESRNKAAFVPDQGSVRVSQLNLIDLAGSEKATSDVERRQEGGYINKSLLSLGNVISQILQKMHNEKVHVQYRSSTLTRVLQTALSGNARISIICTINPTWRSKDESLNTLRFAQRAKQIRTSAKMTKINEHSELQKCLSTIADLQSRVQEKTEQEFETKERLSQLLSLILTSSKNAPTTVTAVSKLADRVVTSDSLLSHSTMQEVFAQCEQGLTATREEMVQLQQSLESSQLIASEQKDHIREQERQIARYTASLARFETALASANRDREEYAQQVQEYREHIKELTSRMASLENELIASKERQDDLVQVIVTREDDDDQVKHLNQSLQEQVALLQEQLEEATMQSDSEDDDDDEKDADKNEQQQQAYQLRVQELEQELTMYARSLEQTTAELAFTKQQQQQLQQELQEKDERLVDEALAMVMKQQQQQQQEGHSSNNNAKDARHQLNIPVLYGGVWSVIAATAMYAYSIST
ncbi:P-loop containing nucleoside triphosphate hydrolase protein [Zychaea mexicana]|uniref:P-loop containing nucleoside triphosphate hydrolase protein n=1 Tax=Zychaea mexicana TaxID=64656 RepID=UPI0022FECDF0|nr:P-loop containing nucleoside triphosphate hydrolase protein [Zychaea mexicana]KAI9490954.1 P-loop containing nucleoside triphosphate hydrolase protein [Zychaea mexicana]